MSSEESATLVVADDDPHVRDALEVWFSVRSDWRVSLASNGAEAIELVSSAVDAVVLDREMPILTGDEVVEQLEEMNFDGEIIIVSGCPPDTHLSEGRVASYLTKPIQRADLFETIDRILT